MRFDDFNAMVLGLPGAVLTIKWGHDRVYCLGGKMFAHAGPMGREPSHYLFKASDLAFEMLVDSGAAVPAPYLARARWVQVASSVLCDEDLSAYVRQAHALIAGKLTRKGRAEFGI